MFSSSRRKSSGGGGGGGIGNPLRKLSSFRRRNSEANNAEGKRSRSMRRWSSDGKLEGRFKGRRRKFSTTTVSTATSTTTTNSSDASAATVKASGGGRPPRPPTAPSSSSPRPRSPRPPPPSSSTNNTTPTSKEQRATTTSQTAVAEPKPTDPSSHDGDEIETKDALDKSQTSDKSEKSGNDKSEKSGNDKSEKSGNDKSEKSGNDKSEKSGNDKSEKSGNDKSAKSGNDKSAKSGNDKSSKSDRSSSERSSDDDDDHLLSSNFHVRPSLPPVSEDKSLRDLYDEGSDDLSSINDSLSSSDRGARRTEMSPAKVRGSLSASERSARRGLGGSGVDRARRRQNNPVVVTYPSRGNGASGVGGGVGGGGGGDHAPPIVPQSLSSFISNLKKGERRPSFAKKKDDQRRPSLASVSELEMLEDLDDLSDDAPDAPVSSFVCKPSGTERRPSFANKDHHERRPSLMSVSELEELESLADADSDDGPPADPILARTFAFGNVVKDNERRPSFSGGHYERRPSLMSVSELESLEDPDEAVAVRERPPERRATKDDDEGDRPSSQEGGEDPPPPPPHSSNDRATSDEDDSSYSEEVRRFTSILRSKSRIKRERRASADDVAAYYAMANGATVNSDDGDDDDDSRDEFVRSSKKSLKKTARSSSMTMYSEDSMDDYSFLVTRDSFSLAREKKPSKAAAGATPTVNSSAATFVSAMTADSMSLDSRSTVDVQQATSSTARPLSTNGGGGGHASAARPLFRRSPEEEYVREHVSTVLIVDDSLVNRQLLVSHVQRLGYRTETALDGIEACDRLRAVASGAAPPVDLVLLDLHMPRLDGDAVLRWMMRERERRIRDVPVVMISSSDDARHVISCIKAGAVDYLPKPFDPVLLKARVESCLRTKRLRDLEALRDAPPPRPRPRWHPSAVVLVVRVVGLTDSVRGLSPEETVERLERASARVHDAVRRRGLASAGVATVPSDGDRWTATTAGTGASTRDAAACALDLAEDGFARVGLHAGPVVAGSLAGERRRDVWGEGARAAAAAEARAERDGDVVVTDAALTMLRAEEDNEAEQQRGTTSSSRCEHEEMGTFDCGVVVVDGRPVETRLYRLTRSDGGEDDATKTSRAA